MTKNEKKLGLPLLKSAIEDLEGLCSEKSLEESYGLVLNCAKKLKPILIDSVEGNYTDKDRMFKTTEHIRMFVSLALLMSDISVKNRGVIERIIKSCHQEILSLKEIIAE
ncbi:MAG TPA: hypothetical protein P5089_03230 [Candidatus Portnoybacteria bacterium]|nr:hypothetical protein [Candidatus Portnoybacteria bacterium]